MPWGAYEWPKAILHIDGDAFFASCEQATHPEWRGKPVVTGKERGIVAAASYAAKAKGVSRGVALWDVKKLCPEAIIVPSDYETYSLFSERMFAIMRRYSSEVEEYGIDEGFVDITGLQRPLGMSYVEIARTVQQAIMKELEIGVSLGLSTTKVLAKLGSKHDKPKGFVVISNYEKTKYCTATPLEKIWGMGPRTTAYCQQFGMRTAQDFAGQNQQFITEHFTKPHIELWHELNGRSVYPIVSETKTTYASIGKMRTFTPPSADPKFLYAQLLKNIENACIKARRYNLLARSIVVELRQKDFHSRTVEGTLSRASAWPSDLTPIAEQLFKAVYRPKTSYRATSVTLTGLGPNDKVQASFFEPPCTLTKLQRTYEAIDDLAERFGKHTVHLAGSQSAHLIPQRIYSRGDLPNRKLHRLRGESKRKHLTIPFLSQVVH